MDSHNAINAANHASLEKLRGLVGRLTDADLAGDLGEGWTVGSMLAHLGFFDARVIALFKRWQGGGEVAASPLDAEIVNEAKRPFFQLLPPRASADLALALAEECDALIAGASADLMARMEAAGFPARLDRAHHRVEHVEQVEKAISTRSV